MFQGQKQLVHQGRHSVLGVRLLLAKVRQNVAARNAATNKEYTYRLDIVNSVKNGKYENLEDKDNYSQVHNDNRIEWRVTKLLGTRNVRVRDGSKDLELFENQLSFPTMSRNKLEGKFDTRRGFETFANDAKSPAC